MNKRTRENVARFIITRVIPDELAYKERIWPAHVKDLKPVYYAKLAATYLMLTSGIPNTIHDPVYVWKKMWDYYYIAVSNNLLCHMRFYKNHIILTNGMLAMRFQQSAVVARYDKSLLRSFGITASDVRYVVASCISGGVI